MDPCDTIRNCIESITLNIDRVCKEKADISKQLEETAEKLRGAEQFLPPATPPAVQKIVTGAVHTVAEIAEQIKGQGDLTRNFGNQAGRNLSELGTMNLKRGQFQPGLGGASVPASSAAISRNAPVAAPVGGSWIEKMSSSQGKPYWTRTNSKGNPVQSWVRPIGAKITQLGGRRKTRKAKKSRSKSRKSRH